MNDKTCCFIGHRKIEETDELQQKLYIIIENIIANENVSVFLFGSKSRFNDLCYDVVTALKEKYLYIKRVYVRAEYQYIDDSYKAYLLERYEDTYFADSAVGAGRAVYLKRNFEMIDKSDICVFYYDSGYKPPRRKESRRALTDYQPKSGTAAAYDYAVSKNIKVINVKS